MNNLVCALVTLLLSGAAHGQNTWRVCCLGGPGIDFTDLQAAVAAAAPGDTLLVIDRGPCPGSVFALAAPVIDKPISLVGVSLTYVTPPPPSQQPTWVPLVGVLTLRNIPAGQRLVVSNIISGGGGGSNWGLRIQDCPGEVILDGVASGLTLDIVNCADVKMNHCGFEHRNQPMRIANSTVRLSWTGIFASLVIPVGYDTQPAIDLENSTLTVTGGSFVRGADSITTSSGQWSAKPGILLSNSTLNIGPGARVWGGYLPGFPLAVHFPYVRKHPWSPPSVVRHDSRADGWGHDPVPLSVQQPVTYTHPVGANRDMNIIVAGPPGGFALLMAGDLAASPAPTPFGNLLVNPGSETFLDIVQLPVGNGGFSVNTYFVPPIAQNGHAYVVQSATLSPSGELALTEATAFTVGWEWGRIP